jgi:hypothetical protein
MLVLVGRMLVLVGLWGVQLLEQQHTGRRRKALWLAGGQIQARRELRRGRGCCCFRCLLLRSRILSGLCKRKAAALSPRGGHGATRAAAP